jgi:hypothetical protein
MNCSLRARYLFLSVGLDGVFPTFIRFRSLKRSWVVLRRGFYIPKPFVFPEGTKGLSRLTGEEGTQRNANAQRVDLRDAWRGAAS